MEKVQLTQSCRSSKRDILLLAFKFSGVTNNHFVDLEGWKDESTLEPHSDFEPTITTLQAIAPKVRWKIKVKK